MLKSLLQAALVAAAVFCALNPAYAGCGSDNPNCVVPTAPPGTNTDQAASTAFVRQAVTGAGNVTGPGSATVGHMAVFENTSGTSIGDGGAPATGNVTGPGSATVGHLAVFNNAQGTLLSDGGAPGAAVRIKLSANTTFYVATTGTDNGACGLTSGAPCATRQYLYSNILLANYDVAGFTVTIQLAAGTYTDTFAAAAPLIGQNGPGGLIFTGTCTSGHTSDALIQPTAAGNSYALSDSGTGATLQCQKLDHSKKLASNPADIVSVGQNASLILGNQSLFGQFADLTFGCDVNPYNAVTIAFRAYVTVVNDITIDPTACQVPFTGTTANNSATITSISPNTTGIVKYMGLAGAGLPTDAYVNSLTSNTITIGCLRTSPCQANASASGVSFAAAGGGQDFFDLGNSGQLYINTNGDPSFSILFNFVGYAFYTAGFIFSNMGSMANFQGITFVLPGFAQGECAIVEALSVISANQGIPYTPCNANAPVATTTASSVTAGADTVAVASAANFSVGDIISDVADPNATWTAGSPTITVTSNANIVDGAKATGPGILGGAVVTKVSGTSITLGGCSTGPRCVSGNPTYLSETSQTVNFAGGCLGYSSVITAINSNTLTLSSPVVASCSSITIWKMGRAIQNSVYQYILKRDLDPASNDNTPAFMNAAA